MEGNSTVYLANPLLIDALGRLPCFVTTNNALVSNLVCPSFACGQVSNYPSAWKMGKGQVKKLQSPRRTATRKAQGLPQVGAAVSVPQHLTTISSVTLAMPSLGQSLHLGPRGWWSSSDHFSFLLFCCLERAPQSEIFLLFLGPRRDAGLVVGFLSQEPAHTGLSGYL